MTPLMARMKAAACWYWTFYKWSGPRNIRAFELKRTKHEIFLLGFLIRAERRTKGVSK